ncbi:MAG: hypothetical protein QXG98_00205 [Candidatus Micrarchaeia archaeon]
MGRAEKLQWFVLGFLVGVASVITLLVITSFFAPPPFLAGLLSLYRTSLELGADTYRQGEAIRVMGTTRCAPEAQIFVDGRLAANVSVQNGDFAAFVPSGDLEPGLHNISLVAGPCTRALTVRILGTPCTRDGETLPCRLPNGCEGIRVCIGGAFTACSPTGRICEPGTKRGCTISDKCGTGEQTCNECGTGWSECVGRH